MIHPAPKPPAREKKAPKPLPRNTKPIARASWLAKSTKPIRESNPERRRRREKAYKKFIGSALWERIRQATFAHDDYTCVKCGYQDESRTGIGLVADHLHYQRFGGQEIIGEDTRTLCRTCDRTNTMATRPNWFLRIRRALHIETSQ